jgi:hypothetical protein
MSKNKKCKEKRNWSVDTVADQISSMKKWNEQYGESFKTLLRERRGENENKQKKNDKRVKPVHQKPPKKEPPKKVEVHNNHENKVATQPQQTVQTELEKVKFNAMNNIKVKYNIKLGKVFIDDGISPFTLSLFDIHYPLMDTESFSYDELTLMTKRLLLFIIADRHPFTIISRDDFIENFKSFKEINELKFLITTTEEENLFALYYINPRFLDIIMNGIPTLLNFSKSEIIRYIAALAFKGNQIDNCFIFGSDSKELNQNSYANDFKEIKSPVSIDEYIKLIQNDNETILRDPGEMDNITGDNVISALSFHVEDIHYDGICITSDCLGLDDEDDDAMTGPSYDYEDLDDDDDDTDNDDNDYPDDDSDGDTDGDEDADVEYTPVVVEYDPTSKVSDESTDNNTDETEESEIADISSDDDIDSILDSSINSSEESDSDDNMIVDVVY